MREVRLLQSEIKSLHERLDAQVADSAARLQECSLLAAQLAELREQFAVVEADRIARGQAIEAQGRRNTEVEALVFLTEQNRDWHRNEAERLGAQLAARDEHIARTGSRWWFRLGRRLRLL